MRGKDARPPPEMAMQKFSVPLHKPIMLLCFKTEKNVPQLMCKYYSSTTPFFS